MWSTCLISLVPTNYHFLLNRLALNEWSWPSPVPFTCLYTRLAEFVPGYMFVVMRYLLNALELLLKAPLNENCIWFFPCCLPEFPRKMFQIQWIPNRICWHTQSLQSLSWSLLVMFTIHCYPVVQKTCLTPNNFIFLRICDCKSQTKTQSLKHRRTTALLSHSTFPRCPGSLCHSWMTKCWRIPPYSKCTIFLDRVIFLFLVIVW